MVWGLNQVSAFLTDLLRRLPASADVVGDPASDAASRFRTRLESVEADAFVFQRSPETLDAGIIYILALAVHRDFHPGIDQELDEGRTGFLTIETDRDFLGILRP